MCWRLPFIVAVVLLNGCISQQVRNDDADLLNTTNQVLTLVASRPGLAATGNDFLFLSPVSIWHNTGTRHFLWLGLGSTIDRELTGTDSPKVERIVLSVDGVPMYLEIRPWTQIASAHPYQVDVPLFVSYGVRVTVSQLERIAYADELQAEIVESAGASTTFVMTEKQTIDWSALGVFSRN